MSSVTEVSKVLALDLTDIPVDDIKKAKKQVRKYLLNETLRHVGNGQSPVNNESFQKLTKDYAKDEKGGSRLPNLELEGDMLFALKTKDLDDNKIKIGIKGSQAPKADGHNQISGEAKAWAKRTERTEYKRRFIPDGRQGYNEKIKTGINQILDSFRETEDERRDREEPRVEERTSTEETTSVSTRNIFSDENIEDLLRREFEAQGAEPELLFTAPIVTAPLNQQQQTKAAKEAEDELNKFLKELRRR